MGYVWHRLSPEEKREVHYRYMHTFPLNELKEGFEPYHEVLQLVSRTAVFHKVKEEFNVFLAYRNNKLWPGMELRAWSREDDFRFKQGAGPDVASARDLSTILSQIKVDMHMFEGAKFGKNYLPDLNEIANTLISNALNRPTEDKKIYEAKKKSESEKKPEDEKK